MIGPSMLHGDQVLGDAVTFRLADLELIHNRERHPLELRDALGDGALLQRLPPLAHLRRALISQGYRFIPAQEIFGLHCLFPVLELMEILATKTIPYRRTADVVRNVLERRPDLILEDVMFREICVGSYTFHEGAHAIFYESACALEGVPTERRLVEVLLASEAFAMAFEQYATLLSVAEGGRATPLFLALSSYANPLDFAKFERLDAGSIHRLARLAVDFPTEVLRFLASAHFVAILRPTAGAGKPELANWIAGYAGLHPFEARDAEHLLSIGFHVDFEFRDRTQRQFFGYLGLEAELRDVRATPLSESFTDGAAFHTVLPRCVLAVLGSHDQ